MPSVPRSVVSMSVAPVIPIAKVHSSAYWDYVLPAIVFPLALVLRERYALRVSVLTGEKWTLTVKCLATATLIATVA